ncbi:hypothetical protein PHSC3_002015 [Chlamydiales bacterium STE3]|nr:hypothetical protein PHSC3_002015 [Chlamydiales bacterium STE3]
MVTRAERIGEIIYLYWRTENKVHWHLDVTFNEDKSQVPAGDGAENFTLLKRCLLNIAKADTTVEASIKLKKGLLAGNLLID